MENTQRYFSKRKPKRCPACGSLEVASIAYGYPSLKMAEAAAEKKIVLGGCCISYDDPSWECTSCGTQIYKPDKLQ